MKDFEKLNERYMMFAKFLPKKLAYKLTVLGL